MNRIASLLSAAVVSALTLSAHASVVNPITDGYLISVNGTTLTTNNLLADLNLGAPANSFLFSDGLTQYVFSEVNVANAVGALSVAELCVTINFAPCKASAVSISNAKLGAISLGVDVNASLTAAVGANLGLLNLGAVADLGLNSATVAFAAPITTPPTSPVPEPGTLSLMASGLLGAAGALRRKFIA
jgi:hypothetical protein